MGNAAPWKRMFCPPWHYYEEVAFVLLERLNSAQRHKRFEQVLGKKKAKVRWPLKKASSLFGVGSDESNGGDADGT